jgi:tRNA(fMet)-specific endonuclease VapC
MHEVLYGIEKYSKYSHSVLQIPTLGYNKDDSELSVVLELSAERKGRSVPRMDAIVASIAINNGCSLYTLDEHFEVFTDDGLKLFR